MRPPGTFNQGSSFFTAGLAPGEGEGPDPPVPWVVAHPVSSTTSTTVPASFMGIPVVMATP
jgi:hypothetical protein